MILSPILFALNLGLSSHQGLNDWKAPETTLPKEFVESVRFMLAHGFANPRGGHFSIATIMTSNIWDPSLRETRVRGWITPAKPGQPKTIVLPNGLSYPVIAVIRGADINEGLVEPPPNDRISISDFYYHGYAASACLLLTGNTSLAEKRFPQNNINPLPNTFMGIAYDYLNLRFQRAVEAHMRGDDALAFNDSYALKKDYDAYEQEATRLLGAKYFERLARPELGGDGKPIAFRTLKQIDSLVEDSLRRIQKNGGQAKLEAVLKLPQDQRIIRLIDMLDQVSVRQFSQPGGVDLVADPIVQAIVDIGNDAGPKLIDTIESDKRLTRSVSFGRDFFPERNLQTVRKAAFTALRAISGIDDFQGDDKPLDVVKLRAYWAKYGSMNPAERWLATLADDSRSPSQWLAAAENIVDSRVYVTVAGRYRGYREGLSGPMRGESLRNRANPSVSEILAKRARALFGDRKVLSSDNGRIPLEMCIQLVRWDPKGSLNCLRDVSREIMDFIKKDRNGPFVFEYQGWGLANVIDLRHRLGDTEALTDYADYLIHMPHSWLNGDNFKALRLLAKYPTNPACEKAVYELFAKEGAAWNLKESLLDRSTKIQVKNMLASPLIALKPFRDIAQTLLADRSIVGNVKRIGNMTHLYRDRSDSGGMLADADMKDPSMGADGESMPYRICDQIADTFSRFQWDRGPKFQQYWTVAARDRAIDELVKYLDAFSPKVLESLKYPYDWEIYPPVIIPAK